MTIKATAAALALAASLCAQDTTTPKSDTAAAKVTKIIRVNGNASWLVDLARAQGQTTLMANDNLHAVVAAGSPAAVAEVERIIHELDTNNTQKKDVELTFYLVSGSLENPAAAAEPENSVLAPVYRQLRYIVPLKTYRLVNTMLLRSRESVGAEPQISGMLRSLNGADRPGWYHIVCTASADASSVIHVTRLSLDVRVPVVPTPTDKAANPNTGFGIETKLDLREGQKVVVGTSNIEPGEITLFLVVSARIVP